VTGAQGPLLSRASYDRAAHRRTDADWLAQAWTRARVLALSPKSATPVERDAGGVPRLVLRDASAIEEQASRRFLGIIDEVPYFAATVEPDGEGWLTLRDLGPTIGDHEAGLLTSAIRSMVDVTDEKDLDSLFTPGATSALTQSIGGLDEFELIAFLAIVATPGNGSE